MYIIMSKKDGEFEDTKEVMDLRKEMCKLEYIFVLSRNIKINEID
jgi:hypothetical protein